jgi:flagellar basal-body rod modification protein FlgD
MQIDSSVMSPNAVSSSAANNASNTATATTDAIASTSGLGNEDTFLQLLVAQIQNQDPTNPIDSTTFLTQLASFSQLEQLIGIRQDVQQLDTSVTAAPGTTSTSNTQSS